MSCELTTKRPLFACLTQIKSSQSYQLPNFTGDGCDLIVICWSLGEESKRDENHRLSTNNKNPIICLFATCPLLNSRIRKFGSSPISLGMDAISLMPVNHWKRNQKM